MPEGSGVTFRSTREELTGIFQVERLEYEAQLLIVTYGLYCDDSLVAMFSPCNDTIPIREVSRAAGSGDEFLRGKYYPAVRLIAFSVEEKPEGRGIGTSLLRFLWPFFIIGNKTGCRFIVINAYNDRGSKELKGRLVGFYSKRGKFTEYNFKKDSVATPMYCDLSSIRQALMSDQSLLEIWTSKVARPGRRSGH